MIKVKRTFVDGTTEEKEFKTLKAAKLNKGKKKVSFIEILDKVSGILLAVISVFKIAKK